ncbi:hypothetical protein ACFQ1S_14605, partial [Kibdelosporangium lantanae]
MNWVIANIDSIVTRTGIHLVLSLIPIVLGLVISIPLGWVANRWLVARAILVPAAGILYTIPSLALFVFLPLVLGTQILDPINVIVALTVYTVALLIRSVADALAAVLDVPAGERVRGQLEVNVYGGFHVARDMAVLGVHAGRWD